MHLHSPGNLCGRVSGQLVASLPVPFEFLVPLQQALDFSSNGTMFVNLLSAPVHTQLLLVSVWQFFTHLYCVCL